MWKELILSVVGLVGAGCSTLIGGWTHGMTVLCIFMLIDYLTGLIVAGVFKNSPKTENGKIESMASFKGLLRKFGVILLVIVGCQLDYLLDTTWVRDSIVIAFTINELISITENAGLMGVPIPKKLSDAIELLNERGDD